MTKRNLAEIKLAFEKLVKDGDAHLEQSILTQYPSGAKDYIENWLYTLPECKEFHSGETGSEYLGYPLDRFLEFLEEKFPE